MLFKHFCIGISGILFIQFSIVTSEILCIQ